MNLERFMNLNSISLICGQDAVQTRCEVGKISGNEEHPMIGATLRIALGWDFAIPAPSSRPGRTSRGIREFESSDDFRKGIEVIDRCDYPKAEEVAFKNDQASA
jgi:hypothetical protein